MSTYPGSLPSSPSPPAPQSSANGSKRLMNRDFFLLWQGQLASRLGDQAFLVAMMFWTKEATGSSSVMGALLMLSTLPAAVIAPIGGTFADRHSRYAIIVGADVVRGLAVAALAVLMFVAPGETGWILGTLFAVAVTGGVVGSLFTPAIHAALPDLVPTSKLSAANSLNQLSNQGSIFLGQALGGVLYRLLGAPLLFLIDGISFLFSAISEAFIRIPQEFPEKSRGFKAAIATYARETRSGLQWVWQRKGMRTFLITASIVNFFFTPLMVLLPFYVTDSLSRGAEWYGFLLAAMGAGSLVGYAFVGSVPLSGPTRAGVGVSALLGLGVAQAVLGFVQTGWLALVIFFVVGLLTGMINVLVLTLLQASTPGDMRGRVMGLVMAMTAAAMPVGMGLSGVAGDLTGQNLPLLFGGSGTAVLLVSLWATSRPAFREFLGQELTPQEATTPVVPPADLPP